MSWFFDEVDDSVTLADHPALTFPDADWTVAGWLRLAANTGTTFKYFLSWNAFDAVNSWHWYLGEDSVAAPVTNKMLFGATGSNGTAWANGTNQPSTASIGTSTAWQHVVLRYTKSTKTLQYSVNGANDYSWVVTGATSDINHTGLMYFGSRASNPSGRYFGGRLAEFAKWNRRISDAEVTALYLGDAPSLLPESLAWYCPMIDDFSESVVGITATSNGGAAVDADHPTINYGSGAHQVAAAASQQAVTTSAAAVRSTHLIGANASVSATHASTVAVSTPGLNLASAAGSNQGIVTSAVAIKQTHLIAAANSSQAVTALAVAVAPTIVLSSPLDRGTLDLPSCTVTPNGTTPLIFVRNRWFNDNSGGARFCYFRIDGVNGMTPIFDIDKTNIENASFIASCKWSYTGGIGTWNDFSSTTTLASPARIRTTHSAAFTQDTVYVALNYPWPIAYTLPWIQSLEASGLVSEAPSSAGLDYVFHTRSATTNGATSGAGDVIPPQPLYSFRISSGGLAPDGSPKRKMVLLSGLHAAEDVGSYSLKGAVEFLISADAQAVTVRDWFDTYVYPVVSSAGRAGGATRNDFEDLYKGSDTNREWNTTHIETVVAHQAAIATDAGSKVDVAIDFHGDTFGTASQWHNLFQDNGGAEQTAYRAKWAAAIGNYRTINVNAMNTAGCCATWFSEHKGTHYTMAAEGEYFAPYTLAVADKYGADHVRTVAYLAAAGEFAATGIVVAASVSPVTSSTVTISQLGASSIGIAPCHQAVISSGASIRQTHLIVMAPAVVDSVAAASSIVQMHRVGVQSSSVHSSASSAGATQDNTVFIGAAPSTVPSQAAACPVRQTHRIAAGNSTVNGFSAAAAIGQRHLVGLAASLQSIRCGSVAVSDGSIVTPVLTVNVNFIIRPAVARNYVVKRRNV